jgi:hypothetical protein
MYQLVLPEGASPRIEALLAVRCCPVHTGTTLDGGECELCVLDELEHIGARMAELEAEFGQHTATYLRLEERGFELDALLAR